LLLRIQLRMLWLLRHDERMMLRMYGLSLEGRIRQASLIQREAEEIIGDVLLAAGVERNARSARTVKDRSTGCPRSLQQLRTDSRKRCESR
jgi:hypothetical protein